MLDALALLRRSCSARASQTGGSSTSAHFQVYDFIPQILHSHPLFGLGLNNFSVYYEFVTGKTNWGPHSFYVALLVETGLVGTALFAVFLFWVFRRLARGARARRARSSAPATRSAARVRPLAWGMTAALAGTMAANAFYLTMQFYYFYAFLALALAVPLVFAAAQSESPTGSGTRSSRAQHRARACRRAPSPRSRQLLAAAGSAPARASRARRPG